MTWTDHITVIAMFLCQNITRGAHAFFSTLLAQSWQTFAFVTNCCSGGNHRALNNVRGKACAPRPTQMCNYGEHCRPESIMNGNHGPQAGCSTRFSICWKQYIHFYEKEKLFTNQSLNVKGPYVSEATRYLHWGRLCLLKSSCLF